MDDQNRNQGQGNQRNAGNLSEEDRRKGGERSAEMQDRDERGRFEGTSESSEGRGDQAGGSQGAGGQVRGNRGGGNQGRGRGNESGGGRSR